MAILKTQIIFCPKLKTGILSNFNFYQNSSVLARFQILRAEAFRCLFNAGHQLFVSSPRKSLLFTP